ncbi:hypothetical protein KY290_028667 [Solanum tuberosum]|uniref:Acid phosphatase 1 n=1 Tax=Solanum tuberosum TaxID=4113 RepID=A0ABQ7UIJ2_SOLTU|nr:hypothetical protein KY290_028667 [Solanum tuberosum]
MALPSNVGYPVPQLDCLSWRLAVETNNLQNWKLVPKECENYVGLKLNRDGKDVWVFDVDDTTLSNLPYYARSDVRFGTIALNNTKFIEWLAEGKLPVIPSIQGVYKTLLSLGINPVLTTGAPENFRQSRIANLKKAGYSNWLKLVLRGGNDSKSAVEYKSSKRMELVKGGYRIVGNIGDQWIDLIGGNVGARTFKDPKPMYYVG